VFWYHNGKMINYESERRGLTVSVDRGPKTHSRLSVEHATEKDTGNYTCSAAHTKPDSINVFVSEGECFDCWLYCCIVLLYIIHSR
jgi:hypothetical protein